MSNNILRFADLGEATTRRILAGWCGPLVPEPPSNEHDHSKTRLMYMDCTSPETVEGHVLTFTYSQWSRGTELVFENGTPRGTGADVAVGRRVLSWETCWQWIHGAGMDCTRPEVAAHLLGLCLRAADASGNWNRHGMACEIWAYLRDGYWPDDDMVLVLADLTIAIAPQIAALP